MAAVRIRLPPFVSVSISLLLLARAICVDCAYIHVSLVQDVAEVH